MKVNILTCTQKSLLKSRWWTEKLKSWKKTAVDKMQQRQRKANICFEYQYKVFILILFSQYLAKHDGAFHGTNGSIFPGKFVDLVKIIWNEELGCLKPRRQIQQ